MTKLVIQIPCFNEAGTLPMTLAELPSHLPGIDHIDVLVIDDGSTDGTAEVARAHGVREIIRHTANQGLGHAFRSGLDKALAMGADIIVNTDADGQYPGDNIARLLAPILAGEADIVIGDRRPGENPEASRSKRFLQRTGSRVVGLLAGVEVADAVSGFRALSQRAALRINILSRFSYTVEMILQAASKDLPMVWIPVTTRAATRPSRLFRNIPQFVGRQLVAMLRMYAMYSPVRIFFTLGAAMTIAGLLPIGRFLWLYLQGQGDGHIQSLLLGGILLTLGFLVFVTGLLADLISQQRQLQEITLEKVRTLEAERRTTFNE